MGLFEANILTINNILIFKQRFTIFMLFLIHVFKITHG